MARWDFRSQDPDEVQSFLGDVYTENEFKLLATKGSARTRIYGGDTGDIAQYNVSYTAPFTFLSETDRDSFLILSCTAGTGTFRQGGEVIEFNRGCVGLISATKDSRVKSGDSFAHISTHINAQTVNAYCARLLGHPIDEPVLFAHAPFSDALSAQWHMVTRSLSQLLEAEDSWSIAIGSLKEHAAALLLEGHPHNYSEQIRTRQSATPRAIDDAIGFIEQNGARPITVSDVAAFAGCGVGALHEGFCERFGVTPRAYLRRARLAVARERLVGEGEHLSPAALARTSGFGDFNRFEAAYRARYDESPSDALRRTLRSTNENFAHDFAQSSGALTPAKIDLLRHHINVSLGERLTVEDLAATVGMSPQSFTVFFKRSFKTTPAQYVLGERVKWARNLLAHTDTPISAIAAETGFSSQSHLTATLKRWNDQTPHELRKSSRLG
jgi:transcriptional regulator GlxA family with amidase domain